MTTTTISISLDATESNYPPVTSTSTVTSYMPLTTVFTPPSGCENSFRLDGPSLMGWDPGYMLDVNSDARCCPPQMVTWWEQALLGGGGTDATEMSIGPFTGPESWPTVASSIYNSYSTLWMCCPSGYFLSQGTVGEVIGRCLSSVYSGMTLTYASTPLNNHTDWTIVTTTLTTDSTVGAIDIVGWEIKYPVTVAATATSTSTGDSTASTSTSTSSTLPTSIEDQSSNSDNGISTASKIGIGIGAGVGAVGIIALLLAFYLFHQRKKLAMQSRQPVAAYEYYPPVVRNSRPTELQGFRGMPGDAWGSPPVEMGAR